MTSDRSGAFWRALRAVDRWLEPAMMVVLCSTLVVCLAYSAIVRYFLPIPALTALSHSAEELAIFAFVWLLYWGAVYATREGAHFRVTAHIDLLPERWRPWAFIPGDLLWLAFNAFVVWQGWLLVYSAIERSEPSLSLQIPMQYVYAVIPLTFLLTCFRLVQFHWRRVTGKQAALPTAPVQL